MNRRGDLVVLFAVVGMVSAFAAVVFVLLQISPVMRQAYNLPAVKAAILLMPITGGIVTAAIASRFDPARFGPMQGIAVGVASLAAVCVLLTLAWAAMAADIMAAIDVLIGALYFGFLFFGVPAMFVGGAAGAFHQWRVASR